MEVVFHVFFLQTKYVVYLMQNTFIRKSPTLQSFLYVSFSFKKTEY